MVNSTSPSVEQIRVDLNSAHDAYAAKLSAFLQLDAGNAAPQLKIVALHEMHSVAVRFFNAAETLVPSSSLAGANQDDYWVNWLAETAVSVLETIAHHFDAVFNAASGYQLDPESFRPSQLAYVGLQRVALKFYPNHAERLLIEFRRLGLPIGGFTEKRRMLSIADKASVRRTGIGVAIAGAAFLVLMLILAIFVPNPTQWQEMSFRVALALAAGAIGGVLPGFVTFSGRMPGIQIRAGGALAIFLIVYLMNPASFVTRAHDDSHHDNSPSAPVEHVVPG